MKSKVRFQLFAIASVLLLTCAVVLILPLSSSPRAGAASVPTRHGVDRMGTEYACASGGTSDFDGPVDQASVSAMLTWKVQIVRVPLNEDCWLGINGFPANGKSASQYQSDIVNWVNLLRQNGLTVILDLHWNNSGSNRSTGQEPMPDLDHSPAFWTSVANTFKSDSSVYFDLYNEPFTTSWSCWKNGSTGSNASPCNDVGFAVAGMQMLVNTVRATGATNLIMLGGLAFSNNLTGWLANKPTDPQNNLAASVHIYNFNFCANTGCWDSQIAPVAAQVPVIAGEIGENDCSSGFINTLMNWLDQHNISYLAWTWTATGNCSGTPSLINDYTGTPTNYGVGYRAHLQSLGGGGGNTPTPTPTRGNTPTPTPTRGTTPTPTPTRGTSACSVHYAITNQWQGGFGTSVTINNTGSTTINGWTLVFTFPATQSITQIWNATETQSGERVTVNNVSYDGTIAPGGSTSFGFNASWSGSNPPPTAFTLNGAGCSLS